MTGVDTLAALSTGAYVLSESYLYTTEAIHEFLDHLTPNGLLSYTVADFNGPKRLPRHTCACSRSSSRRSISAASRTRRTTSWCIRVDEAVPQVSLLLKNCPSPTRSAPPREFVDDMGLSLGVAGRGDRDGA